MVCRHRQRVAVLAAVGLLAASGPGWAQEPAAATDTRRRTAVVDVFESARDAVVSISATQIIEVRSPFGFDSFFGDLFDFPRRGPTRKYRKTGIGSGFVLHRAGYIVTNAHVVARTAERKVVFAEGPEYDAEVVAIDPERDLAVLKIEADHPLEPLDLGTSSDLMVGETVIAIGNPLGYQHTVTAGVISALDRSLPIDERRTFDGLIQTDASINPGNSGGPLLNILGQLVGINTAIRADAQNIGFAIPVNQLRELLPEMLDVHRRYRITTGLVVADLPWAPRGAGGPGGCRVVSVTPGSPAQKAGLTAGDVITAVEEKAVTSAIDFHIALIGTKAGQNLTLTGTTGHHFKLTLAERPRPDGTKLLRTKLGIEAKQLAGFGARGRSQNRRGLRVSWIERGGPADQIDLRPGDTLFQIGRYQPADLDEVGELLDHVKAGDEVQVGFQRVLRQRTYRIFGVLISR